MDQSERLQRILTITTLAARMYLGYKAISFRERHLGLRDAEARRSVHHRWCARQIYSTAVRLQGPMIKLGQAIGSRPDLVPQEYVQVLSRLQDQVPPRPFKVIEEVLRRELKRPEAIFAEFAPEPIAAASWAQVHKAKLKDGRVVAVKVQYPGIQDIVHSDMWNIGLLLRLLNLLERGLNFNPIVQELNEYMPLELDFLNEGRNAELIAKSFQGHNDVVVPKVIWQFSTRRVLVLEYLEGIKISDVPSLKQAGIDPQSVAQLLTEIYCEQLFVHGLFNADPHPGNFLVAPGPKLILLDFGLCRRLPPSFRQGYVHLTKAMLLDNRREMMIAFKQLGVKIQKDDPRVFALIRQSFVEVTRPGKAYADADLVFDANERLARALRNNPLSNYPREFVLILRTVGLLSGLAAILDSRVDWVGTALRYLDGDTQEILRSGISPLVTVTNNVENQEL